MKRFLLLPGAADGGDNKPANPNPAQPPAAQPPAAQPPAAQPPAACAVLNGDRTERELKLEEDLRREKERADRSESEKRERETKIAELEDQLSQLRSSQAPAVQESKPFRLRRVKL